MLQNERPAPAEASTDLGVDDPTTERRRRAQIAGYGAAGILLAGALGLIVATLWLGVLS